jgi:hypothetical protein
MILEGTGVLYEYTHEEKEPRDVTFASVTAKEVERVAVLIDDKPWDVVYAGNGGSHSWWSQAGGKLLPPEGLQRGQTLRIESDGPVAFRLDWQDGGE